MLWHCGLVTALPFSDIQDPLNALHHTPCQPCAAYHRANPGGWPVTPAGHNLLQFWWDGRKCDNCDTSGVPYKQRTKSWELFKTWRGRTMNSGKATTDYYKTASGAGQPPPVSGGHNARGSAQPTYQTVKWMIENCRLPLNEYKDLLSFLKTNEASHTHNQPGSKLPVGSSSRSAPHASNHSVSSARSTAPNVAPVAATKTSLVAGKGKRRL
jgi:hypothetical protein